MGAGTKKGRTLRRLFGPYVYRILWLGRMFSSRGRTALSDSDCRSGLLLEVMWVNDHVASLLTLPGTRAVVGSVTKDETSGRDILNVIMVDNFSLETGITWSKPRPRSKYRSLSRMDFD